LQIPGTLNLGLESRFRFEAGVGDSVVALLDGSDKRLESVVAAGVTYPSEPVQYSIVLFEEIPDYLMMRFQNGRLFLFPPVFREGIAFEIFRNCLPVQLQLVGDEPDAMPCFFQLENVHAYLHRDHLHTTFPMKGSVPCSPGWYTFRYNF